MAFAAATVAPPVAAAGPHEGATRLGSGGGPAPPAGRGLGGWLVRRGGGRRPDRAVGAVAHVQRRRRYYSCFAYWFSASPPFRLLAATREFRFPDVGRGGALVEAESAGKPGPEDRIQFPMGVARAAAGDAVLVSWGAKANAESRVTALPLAALAPLTTALR